MPRQPFLDDAKKDIACSLARAGMSGRWIAAHLGCDESTLRYALGKDESFRARYMQGRAELQIDQLANIAKAATKSWRAAVWLLERLFPKEYNLRQRAKHFADLDELGFPATPEAGEDIMGFADAPMFADPAHPPEASASNATAINNATRTSSQSPLDANSIQSNPLCQFLNARRAALDNPFADPDENVFEIPIYAAPAKK